MGNDNIDEQKVEDMKPVTEVQRIQKILYDEFSDKVFSMEGLEMQVEGELPELFVPRSAMIDNILEVLNNLGEVLAKEGESNETDKQKN